MFENLELFEDVKARFGATPKVTISGKTGRLNINQSFWNQIKSEFINNFRYLYVLHAKNGSLHLIGLRFSDKREKGAISVSTYQSGASASIKSFLDKYKIPYTVTKPYDVHLKETEKFGKIYYFEITGVEK